MITRLAKNPLHRVSWLMFKYRGRVVHQYKLRDDKLNKREMWVRDLAYRFNTTPENIVVDIEFRD